MKKYLRIILFFVLIFVLLWISHSYILESFAKYLIVQDELKKVYAIVVLSGDSNGERIRQATELYRKGYGKYFLISGGLLYWNTTYADIMRRHAISLGIPGKAILVEDKSESTYENAKFSLPILKEKGIKSIILVSSPTHTRRARRLFKKMYKKEGIDVLTYPVQNSRFITKNWWLRHEDTQRVVMEYVKIIGYFIKGW